MTTPKYPLIYIDLYQSKPRKVFRRPQTWRWRALNAGNSRVLAVSSENYTNRDDAVSAVRQLFGSGSDVYLRQTETGNVMLRLANLPQA